MSERINHPAHYGGASNPYEAIKVIEAWQLGFNVGNAVKYIARAGKKEGSPPLEDLLKARWYLDRDEGCCGRRQMARPKVLKERVGINVYMTREMLEWLRKRAVEEGRSPSAIIRMRLEAMRFGLVDRDPLEHE
jgi:hypothetical protein